MPENETRMTFKRVEGKEWMVMCMTVGGSEGCHTPQLVVVEHVFWVDL